MILNDIGKYKYEKHKRVLQDSKLAYVSPDHQYTNVLLSCPVYHQNKWQGILALQTFPQSSPYKIIINSNSFYWDNKGWQHQNGFHQIYDRMIYNYHHMCNFNREKYCHIHEECLLLGNTFTGVNSGHDLSVIMDTVNYYRKHSKQIQKIVILKSAHWFPNNLILLRLLLAEDANKLLEIEWNDVYYFDKIHIIKADIINLPKHTYLIDELRKKILDAASPTGWTPNQNVALLKTHRNKNVVTVKNQLTCEKLLTELQKRTDWVIADPELQDILVLCATLMHAKQIVFSHGSILYTHMIFFNPKAKLQYVSVSGDRLGPAYDFVKSLQPTVISIKTGDLDNNAENYKLLFNKLGLTTAVE